VRGLGIAAVVLVADQASKAWLLDLMEANQFRMIEVTGFFNLVMVWNPGVSFGMFATGSEGTRWLLTAVALVISAGLVWWLRRQTAWLAVVAIGLVIGGALGNAIDRIVFGAVADFFDFHVAGWSWPAFNVADSAITVGVLLLLLDAFLAPRAAARPDAAKKGGRS